MTLAFSKSFVFNKTIYKVYDGEQLKGEFLSDKKGSYIKYSEERFVVDKRNRTISKGDSAELLGHYGHSKWAIFRNTEYKLFCFGKEYAFKKDKPDIAYSIFKRDTWGHCKFKLTTIGETITYSFQVGLPRSYIGNAYFEQPFSGRIEIDNTNIAIALLGFYLLERALDDEEVT